MRARDVAFVIVLLFCVAGVIVGVFPRIAPTATAETPPAAPAEPAWKTEPEFPFGSGMILYSRRESGGTLYALSVPTRGGALLFVPDVERK